MEICNFLRLGFRVLTDLLWGQRKFDLWCCNVGDDSDQFTVEVHHGGFFVGQGSNRSYIDGKVNWFDYCEGDTWSPLWFDDFVGQLGYEPSYTMKIYWLLPEHDFSDGLRMIASDSETRLMVSVVNKVRNFVVFFDHDDNISGINWEDIVANPIASLPKVMSPSKVEKLHINRGEKLSSFHSNQNNSAEDFVEATVGPVGATRDEESGSDIDEDFVDSDYELENQDDDLFVENVDEDVIDEGVARGNTISKGEKASDSKQNRRMLGHSREADSVSSDEDELYLPESDDEDQARKRYKSFGEADLDNPVFKVGMIFDSVQILRKAITEYSLKHRVEIRLPRNEKKRLRAQCADGCPWNLYASSDTRINGLMVKTYTSQHNCQKQWVLKRCTSKWLASKYVESFRADQKLSLTNFARIVQKELNITPPRTKLARARRLAMKQILGDEEEQYKRLWDYGHELRRSNPGSTFFLNLDGNLFSYMYVSLDACKRGFLTGCRPLICLDGCHLKTKYGGIMLTAVGIDPNDCIYPIAYAVVEVESLASWKWFLQTLKEDLGIENTYPWTIMTDKQKVKICSMCLIYVD